jgi:hypothetical protein
VTASNIKLALMYDWLFFEPTRDSIMNIGMQSFKWRATMKFARNVSQI